MLYSEFETFSSSSNIISPFFQPWDPSCQTHAGSIFRIPTAHFKCEGWAGLRVRRFLRPAREQPWKKTREKKLLCFVKSRRVVPLNWFVALQQTLRLFSLSQVRVLFISAHWNAGGLASLSTSVCVVTMKTSAMANKHKTCVCSSVPLRGQREMIRARLEVNAGVLTLGADRDTLLTATCQANKPTHSRGNTVTPVMFFFFLLLETPKASKDMMSTTEWKKNRWCCDQSKWLCCQNNIPT